MGIVFTCQTTSDGHMYSCRYVIVDNKNDAVQRGVSQIILKLVEQVVVKSVIDVVDELSFDHFCPRADKI